MVTGTSYSQKNPITSNPQRKSISIMPLKTGFVMNPQSCYPISGNSKDIINFSMKPDNGTRKPAKLFTNICNLFREDAGQPKLLLIFFNPNKKTRFTNDFQQKLHGKKLSFIQSGDNVPDIIKQKSEHGYLVSPTINAAIEAKVTTAKAGEILNDPQERAFHIQDFLKIKGIHDPEFAKKLDDAVTRSVMPSGVVTAQSSQEAILEVKSLLEKYRETGIVFQTNEGAGGKGTAILSAKKIHQILKKTDSDILQAVSDIMNYEKDFKGTLAEEIKTKGLSWQKMTSGKELCVMFRSNPEKKEIEMTSASIKFVGKNGNHLGNIIIDIHQLEDIAGVSLNDEQIKLFTAANELMLHTMLKLEGYKEGINEIYNEDGSNLKAFSNDTFFSIAPDGNVKHEISEFNARPPSSAHAIVSGESIDAQTPFMRLYTPFTPMSKEVFDSLQTIGAEKAHEFFKQKFEPILKKFDGAFIDTFVVDDKSAQNDANEHLNHRWSIFYPHPDIQTKGEKEFEAMKEIHKICENLTAKEILESQYK